MNQSNYDIETCTWCNGEGIDQSFKGNPYHQPNCGRCKGSGKIYVTDELSTTGRRRRYVGPVPKIIPGLIEKITSDGSIPVAVVMAKEPKPRRGRPPKIKQA